VRRARFGEGDACDLTRSYIPFAVTKAQRMQSGDPRPLLEGRYGTLANYTALARAAADKLVAQRLLLERMGRRASKARQTRRNRRG
jgi:hypothetical protein